MADTKVDPRLAGSKAGWVWFGFAGHLVVGRRCAFHLATYMPEHKLFVSTVGDYLPDGKKRDTIGAGDKDFYETMVFQCDGVLKGGDPNITSWDAVESLRYETSLEAEIGHYEMLAQMERLRTN